MKNKQTKKKILFNYTVFYLILNYLFSKLKCNLFDLFSTWSELLTSRSRPSNLDEDGSLCIRMGNPALYETRQVHVWRLQRRTAPSSLPDSSIVLSGLKLTAYTGLMYSQFNQSLKSINHTKTAIFVLLCCFFKLDAFFTVRYLSSRR